MEKFLVNETFIIKRNKIDISIMYINTQPNIKYFYHIKYVKNRIYNLSIWHFDWHNISKKTNMNGPTKQSVRTKIESIKILPLHEILLTRITKIMIAL